MKAMTTLALALTTSCATSTMTPTAPTPTPTTPTTKAVVDDAVEAELQRYIHARQARVTALTQQPLTLDAAAEAVGEFVVFEAAVAAVSYKNTPPFGVYLSFGAPYPQQTMSVWFPDKVWRTFREEPKLSAGEKPALRFVDALKLLRGGRGNIPAD